MPNRFEYIQSNLKSNAQQKTQAGLCKAAETILSLVNTFTHLTVGGVAHSLRVWKDAAGTVHLAGAVVAGTTPAMVSGTALIATLPPGFRPSKTVYFPLYYNDVSAAYKSVSALGTIQGTNNTAEFQGQITVTPDASITVAAGDYIAFSVSWVAA